MSRGSTPSGVLTAALLMLAAPCSMREAAASAGCDAVKAGAFKLGAQSEQTSTKTVSDFMVGDLVKVQVKCWTMSTRFCDPVFGSVKLTTGDGSELPFDYRITGQRQDNELTLTVRGAIKGVFSYIVAEATCTPSGE